MTIKSYDLVVIFESKLSENALKELINKVKKIISSMGGEILTEDNWGIKRFAHPIKRNRDGFYYFMKTKLPPDKIKEIIYNIKVTEGVLRVNLLKSMVEVVK